jgi:peptidoglycan/xylan/chitin deacetylase (PgdA/CDA1 family)
MGANVSRALLLAAYVVGLVACGETRVHEPAGVGVRDRAAAGSLPRVTPPAVRPLDGDVLAAAAPRATSSARGETEPREAAPDGAAALQHAEPVDSVVREVFSGDRDDHAIALTFDDGPSRENTPRILDVLEREGVPATFFVLGERAEKMPDLVTEIDDRGHEIGNHTWSHGSLRSMWASQIEDELRRTGDAVFAAIGRRPALFRPPFGRYAPSALPIVGALGMNVVLWSVDGEDWERDPEAIAQLVVRQAGAGDIVLLHDRTATTAAALPAIIRGLRARGFRLVTVSELTGLPAYASAG